MGRPKHKNTLTRGWVRYLVFKEGDTWYAAGLEVHITESGDTPREALVLLFEAIEGYVEAARKTGAPASILNQTANPEYERMWQHRNDPHQPLPIYTYGEQHFSKTLARSLVPA